MRTLRDALMELEDPRDVKGRRYSLVSVLLLIVVALLSGCESINEIVAWGRGLDWESRHRLGFRRNQIPSASTIRRVLGRLDAGALAAVMNGWLEEIGAWLLEQSGMKGKQGLSIDGKRLRGSDEAGEGVVQVLSAALHELGHTVGLLRIPEGAGEGTAIKELLEALVLEERIVTLDALLGHRGTVRLVREKRGTI